MAQALFRQAHSFEPGDEIFPLLAPGIGLGLYGRLDFQHDGNGPEERRHIAFQPLAAERQIGRLQSGEGDGLAVWEPAIRPESKKARLIGMLRQPGGSTIAAISAALGWQAHTTRAAITGLRKAGHAVETAKLVDGSIGLIYRVASR